MAPQNLASLIDHTLLRMDATEEEVFALCRQAKAHKFFSVCVNPMWVKFCKHFLKDTNVKVCSVIGFPLGANTTAAKIFETKQAIQDGADEIDMVLMVGALKSENDDLVFKDVRSVVTAAEGRIVKVTLETSIIDDFDVARGCEIAVQAGAKFIKTSTGFSGGGASVEAIQLIREIVGPNLGIKASGGIRTQEQALEMIEAGATRLGTSASIAIALGEAKS